MAEPTGVSELFLSGALVVAAAIADPAVGRAWNAPSVLEEQLVSGLAGHLARGGVWVVGDYLDGGAPERDPDFGSAAEYFAAFLAAATPAAHQAIRERGASVAAVGQEELLQLLDERIRSLTPRIQALRPDLLISIAGGRVMRLDGYLVTRLVEQSVHLDDLARSAGLPPWPLPQAHQDLVIAAGIEMARLQHGPAGLIRALYRRGFAEHTLPVL